MAGTNKGKKYMKLTGDEIATPEAERKAKHFLDWFGAIYPHIKKRMRDHNEEIAVDTMLQIYNDILYKGVRIQNYRGYFLMAYNTTKLKRAVDEARRQTTHYSIDEAMPLKDNYRRTEDQKTWAEFFAAPDFDYELHETILAQIDEEMLEYVRREFSPAEISIYEIYTGLQPAVSYGVMAKMLGISEQRIYRTVSAIKRELKENFTERRAYLLAIV